MPAKLLRLRAALVCLACLPALASGREPSGGAAAVDPLERFQSLLKLHRKSDAKPPVTTADLLTALRPVPDAQLQQLLLKVEDPRHCELYLTEAIRRGGNAWCDFVKGALQARRKAPADDEDAIRRPLHSVVWLTAIRRLEGKPDPLQVLVAGARKLDLDLGELPVFQALLVNLDRDESPVMFKEGGDYRSGRQARWRFQVTDGQGAVVPQRPRLSFIGGGILRGGVLEYGESWPTDLPMESYIQLLAPGEYTLRVLYHDNITIADEDDITGLIVCGSLPIKISVKPLVVRATQAELADIQKLIRELPDKGEVKLLRGPYGEYAHEFHPPESAAGKLLDHGWQAAPAMIDAVLDEKQSPVRRAWLLSLLSTTTAQNDPGVGMFSFGDNAILGNHTCLDAGWSVSFGAGRRSGGFSPSQVNKHEGGPIDSAKQLEFAKRWATWKDKGYLKVEPTP